MKPFRFARLLTNLPKPPAGVPPDTAIIQALHDGLHQKYELGDIEHSEYDHEFPCRIGNFRYIVSAGFDYAGEQWWEVNFREAPTFLTRIFSQYKEPEATQLALAIDDILQKQKWAQEIRWYKEFGSSPDKDYSRRPVLSA
ncbi:MAG TPA: hypothetical protein VLX68_09530 [Chitinivibrionales bacterium]|nr:hypothetical protein [Chitinivibrionales bacterium]